MKFEAILTGKLPIIYRLIYPDLYAYKYRSVSRIGKYLAIEPADNFK